jgi:hypothetical protein
MKSPFALVKTALLCALVLTSCGKVSAPLPPIVEVPEPVTDFMVSQIGYDLRFTWTNPSRNVDLTPSTDLSRAVIRSDGQIVLEVPVSAPGERQTADLDARESVGSVRTFTIEIESGAERLSAAASSSPVTVDRVPESVSGMRATVDQDRIAVEWDLPAERDLIEAIRVYRSGELYAELGAEATRFEDGEYLPEATYTYVVTAVRAVSDTTLREGVASPPLEVTALDTIPPAVPGGLTLRRVDDTAYLTWDVGAEADVAGYRVFRSDGPGAAFVPLTEELLIVAGYTDAEYVPGHAYAVSAVDRSGNESGRSEAVE